MTPFVATAPVELECRVDDDCGPRLACINNECEDPCEATRPCHHTQICRVENSSPIRTVLCTCPEDTFIGPNGECKPKGEYCQLHVRAALLHTMFVVTPTPSCVTDRDCSDPDKCVDGTCRDACRVDPCGANAICKSRLHASSCSCPIGYTGNPRVQCMKSKFLDNCITLVICTLRMFQSRPTLFLCSLQNVGTTPSVHCTMPASTGNVSTPVR